MIARYKFCLWLVERLSIRRMTLHEIMEEWRRCGENIMGMELTPRTFSRYRALAEEIFRVNIECYKPRNEYWLDADALTDADEWSMSALRLHSLCSMVGMRNHIVVEAPPAGSELLYVVANACREHRVLNFSYSSPYNPDRDCSVIPLFIRLFKQRWYLIGQPVGRDFLTTLALERMKDISTGECATPTVNPDPEEYFSDCYGVIRQHEPERVVIRAFWPQNKYLKEVPLHASQRVEDECENWTDFSLYVRPTYDFKQELLSQRDKVAVISPESLRNDMIEILESMMASYRDGKAHCIDE